MLQNMGVHLTVDLGTQGALNDKFKALRAERPIEASIVFAPSLQAVSDAVCYVDPGGVIVTVALPPGHFSIDVKPFVLKELRLQGSIVGTPRDLQEAIDYVANGKVKPQTKEQPFDTINQILDDLEHGRVEGRVVVRVAYQ